MIYNANTVQFVEPSDRATKPVGHPKHWDTDASPPAEDAVPRGHGVGRELLRLHTKPAGHTSQRVCPGNVPSAQLRAAATMVRGLAPC